MFCMLFDELRIEIKFGKKNKIIKIAMNTKFVIAVPAHAPKSGARMQKLAKNKGNPIIQIHGEIGAIKIAAVKNIRAKKKQPQLS